MRNSERLAALFFCVVTLLPGSLLARPEFLTSRYYPGVEGTYWVATGDLNNDGHMDLVLVAGLYDTGGVYVALGNADGSFQTPVQIFGYLFQGTLTLGDADGDGKLDIIAATRTGDPPRLVVLPGNGDGTFGSAIFTTAKPWPKAIAVADLNGDGMLDAVLPELSGKLDVFLGNGNGTFRLLREIDIGNQLSNVAIGDFNKDGISDVLVSGESSRIYLLLGKGDGTFQSAKEVQHRDGTGGLLLADFNGDGNLDFASSTTYDIEHYTDVSVVLGNGDGTFQPVIQTDFGSYPVMSAVDLNGDDKLDLVNSSGGVALGNGDGTFGPTQFFNMEGADTILFVADVNGDGKLDLYGAGESGTLVVARGRGDGTFVAARTYRGLAFISSAAIGDFNGDGHLDAVAANLGTNLSGQVLLGDGNGGFTAGANFSVGAGAGRCGAGDLNNDGKLDLVCAGTYDISTLLGRGDGTFEPYRTFGELQTGISVALGDFNKDGRLDVAATDYYGGAISVFLGNGDGSLQSQVSYTAGTKPSGLVQADIDSDGNLDLIATNSGDVFATVLYGNGDGTFQPGVQLNTVAEPTAVAAADLNRDGKMDLVFITECPDSNVCSQQVSVYLGNGNRTFTHGADYPAGFVDSSIGLALRIGDLNSDGRLDVVAFILPEFSSQNIGVLLGNGDGTLNPVVNYTGGMDSVDLADFNEDGAVDIGASGSGFTVFLNTAGAKITAQSKPNPSKRGQAVTFSTTVLASVIAQPVPSGTVIFKDSAKTLAKVKLKNGKGSFSASSLSVGTHTITTRYSGDRNFLPKAGPTITQVVKQ